MITLLVLLFAVMGVFGNLETNDSQYVIIDGKQFFSKTIDSRLADLSQQENRYELEGIGFYLDGEKTLNYPSKSMFGYKVPVIIEYPDGFSKEIFIQTKMKGHQNNEGLDYDFEFYKAENGSEVGIFTGLIQSKNLTQFLVFEKFISPLKQIKLGIDPENISCKSHLVLYHRNSIDSICVKPESISILNERLLPL